MSQPLTGLIIKQTFKTRPRVHLSPLPQITQAFALLLNQDYDFDTAQLKTGTALIFTEDKGYSEGGIYLYLTDSDCTLSEEHSDTCTARLIYSITPH